MKTSSECSQNSRSVIEISRRIKSGQREKFAFLGPLKNLVGMDPIKLFATPSDVRVDLISRYDSVIVAEHPVMATSHEEQIGRQLNVRNAATCDEYARVKLGEPKLMDRGDGWGIIASPIIDSDYSFAEERTSLTNRIDKLTGEEGSLWYPSEPVLQIVEFNAELYKAQAILEYVSMLSPTHTEVFDASIRFREAVL